jgi:phage regulator Rha-like protein
MVEQVLCCEIEVAEYLGRRHGDLLDIGRYGDRVDDPPPALRG